MNFTERSDLFGQLPQPNRSSYLFAHRRDLSKPETPITR